MGIDQASSHVQHYRKADNFAIVKPRRIDQTQRDLFPVGTC